MTRHRLRLVLAALAGVALCGLAPGTRAQGEGPTQPVHILVGFGAGGPTDILARLVGEKLAAAWKQPVVVENRPGAGGMIAMEAVTRAAPDGHTLGVLTLNHVVAQELHARPPYRIATDLLPVGGIARQGNVLVVNPALPVKDTAGLVQWLRANGERTSYASGGNGSPAHVAAELFKQQADVRMTHVPYKGAAPALQDVMAGHVALMFAAAPPALPLIRSGRLRAIAVTSDTRMAQLPDLPTLAEAGIAYDVRDWQGLVVPAATPVALVQRLNADLRRVLDLPEVRARIESLGGEIAAGSPSDFAARIAGETTKWRRVVRDANLSNN